MGDARDILSRAGSLNVTTGGAAAGDKSSQGGIGYPLSFMTRELPLLFDEQPGLIPDVYWRCLVWARQSSTTAASLNKFFNYLGSGVFLLGGIKHKSKLSNTLRYFLGEL